MKKSKLLLILALVVVLALGVLVSCKDECVHENYGAWQITKAPTLTTDGEAVRICADCNVAETVTVAKLSDTSVWTPTTTSATHTTAGKTTYASTYGTVEISVDRLVDHVYDKEVAEPQFLVSAADCTNAAVYRKSCVCGAVNTATFTSGTALGHDGKAVAAVAAVHNATTLTNGAKAHYACDRCGLLFSDEACTTEVTAASLVIAVAHDFADALVKAPTCTVDGSATHTCACGKTETVKVAALGHDFTSKTIVPVNPSDDNQTWDGSDWDEEGYDAPTSTTHALVCDRCHTVDVSTAVAHDYTGAKEVFTIEPNKTISSHVNCIVCGHTANGTTNITGVISEYTVVAAESKAATYTEAGFTTYTKEGTSTKFTVVEPKLVAVYEGKTYTPLELTRQDGVVAHTMSVYHWSTASITVDSKGMATGTASPFQGDVVISMVDDTTGEITLKVGDSVYEGYVEPITGVMVISDDGFASAYIVSSYDMTMHSATASYWRKAIAASYHVDCGTYLGHDIGIFVDDDVVYFGASFEDANGVLVAASDCHSQDMLIVKSVDGDVVATYIKNSNGVLLKSDAYRGTYTAMMGDINIGSLEIDGIGGFVLDDKSGVYSATATKDVFDAYVVDNDGNNVEHYTATVANNTITLVANTVEVTFVTGSNGTLDNAKQDVHTNCVINVVPTTTSAIFIGWYEKDGTENDDWGNEVTSVKEATTVYAKYTQEVTVTLVGLLDGDDSEVTMLLSETILNQLPDYENAANAANNTLFAGWFMDADCTVELDEGASWTADDTEFVIYAKWVKGGVWNAFVGDSSFVYNPATDAWRTTTYNSTTYASFYAINGDIVVSFNYYFGSIDGISYAYKDELTVKNGSTTLAGLNALTNYSNANAPLVDSKGMVSVRVKSGTSLQIQAKYGSTNNDTDGVYISNLTINGRKIDYKGAELFNQGTYTCEGEDDLVIVDRNTFTWGELSGTYTLKFNDEAERLVLVSMQGEALTGEYNVTLGDGTYTATQVTITTNIYYGVSGSSEASYYGKLGKEKIEIPRYSTYTLKQDGDDFLTKTDNDGNEYVFIGWFTDKSNTNVATGVDTTKTGTVNLYARYVLKTNAVSLTYNYMVDGKTHTVNVAKNTAIAALHQMPESVTVADKMLAGWFTKDGTTDGDWGVEVTTTSKFTEDTTVYAKWVVPHPLMGIYKGATNGGYNDYSGAVSGTIQITCDGKLIISNQSTWNDGILSRDMATATGATTITKGSNTYRVWVENGMIVITNKTTSTDNFGVSPTLLYLVKVNSDSDAVTINSSTPYWKDADNYIYHVVRVDVGPADSRESKYYYITPERVYADVNVAVVNASGDAVTATGSYKTYGNKLTIAQQDGTEVFVGYYNGSTFVNKDGRQGEYTDSAIGTFTIDGINKVIVGANSYDYTVVSEGVIAVTIGTQHYEISNINATAGTCTVTPIMVTVTFVYDHATVAEVDENNQIQYSVAVSLTLPTPNVANGYMFFGWFEKSDFSGSAATTPTLPRGTETKIYYAKIIAAPSWASAESAETVTLTDGGVVIDSATTPEFLNYYAKITITEAGSYILYAPSARKTGGTGKNLNGSGTANNANYARYTLLNSTMSAVTGASSLSFSSGSTNLHYVDLQAGTYYLHVNIGGNVEGSTYNYDVSGTFKVELQKADYSTVAAAKEYTVGTEETVTLQVFETYSVKRIYKITLEAGKNYAIEAYTPEDRSQLTIRTESNIDKNTNVATSGWINAGQSLTAPVNFTASTGTYYIVVSSNCTFKIVEVTE